MSSAPLPTTPLLLPAHPFAQTHISKHTNSPTYSANATTCYGGKEEEGGLLSTHNKWEMIAAAVARRRPGKGNRAAHRVLLHNKILARFRICPTPPLPSSAEAYREHCCAVVSPPPSPFRGMSNSISRWRLLARRIELESWGSREKRRRRRHLYFLRMTPDTIPHIRNGKRGGGSNRWRSNGLFFPSSFDPQKRCIDGNHVAAQLQTSIGASVLIRAGGIDVRVSLDPPTFPFPFPSYL